MNRNRSLGWPWTLTLVYDEYRRLWPHEVARGERRRVTIVAVAALQKVLGHASSRTTTDLYVHLDTQDVLADLAVIEGRT